MVSPDEAFQVLLEVTRVLDELEVPYVVGGSLASSLHGIPRSTQDADLVAALRTDHIQSFIGGVEGVFYLSPERVETAVRRRTSFNLIHLKTMIKVDLFVFSETPLAKQEMARRQILSIPGEPTAQLQVASPEDTILQKLLWYRKGGGVSELARDAKVLRIEPRQGADVGHVGHRSVLTTGIIRLPDQRPYDFMRARALKYSPDPLRMTVRASGPSLAGRGGGRSSGTSLHRRP